MLERCAVTKFETLSIADKCMHDRRYRKRRIKQQKEKERERKRKRLIIIIIMKELQSAKENIINKSTQNNGHEIYKGIYYLKGKNIVMDSRN